MRLTRYGHACFGLEDHRGRLWLFDPYRPDGLNGRFQLDPITDIPDYIISTHAHEDHAWRAAAWRDVPFLETAQEGAGFRVRVCALPHDRHSGSKMGFTRSMRLDLLDTAAGSWSIVHAGDVGDANDEALARLCKDADVLLLPAGGTYTIGPVEAEEFALRCGAKDIILMHFRETGVDLPMLTPDQAFGLMKTDVFRVESGRIDLDETGRDGEACFYWLQARASSP